MKIFQLEIPKLTSEILLSELENHVLEGQSGKAIFTPNPEICLKTLEDEEFLQVLREADSLTSDGIGLYIAYQMNDFPKILSFFFLPYFFFNIIFRKKFLYEKYGDRICGSDLTSHLVNFAQNNNIKIAIIDPSYPEDRAKCESQRTFRKKLRKKFPRLVFDFYVFSEKNSDEIFSEISRGDAKILFSTLGMKRQELSVIKGLKNCPNVRLGLGVGSSFDYYTGFQKRAPKVWRSFGFEWLYRIFTSPNKFTRLTRIYQAVIVFPIKVLFYREK